LQTTCTLPNLDLITFTKLKHQAPASNLRHAKKCTPFMVVSYSPCGELLEQMRPNKGTRPRPLTSLPIQS